MLFEVMQVFLGILCMRRVIVYENTRAYWQLKMIVVWEGMDIDGDLFEKETSTVELIPRGVEDMLALFDTSEDLHKTLFANLESIIEPLSPRPPPRDTGSKIDSDVPR